MEAFTLNIDRPTYEILALITSDWQRVQEWCFLARTLIRNATLLPQVIDGSLTTEEVVIDSMTGYLEDEFQSLCAHWDENALEQVDWIALANFFFDVAMAEPNRMAAPSGSKDGKIRFNSGRWVVTRGVSETLDCFEINRLLFRHCSGDWGDVAETDRQENERSLESGDRLLSAYNCGGRKVWVITEADRSATTVLLPEEY